MVAQRRPVRFAGRLLPHALGETDRHGLVLSLERRAVDAFAKPADAPLVVLDLVELHARRLWRSARGLCDAGHIGRVEGLAPRRWRRVGLTTGAMSEPLPIEDDDPPPHATDNARGALWMLGSAVTFTAMVTLI